MGVSLPQQVHKVGVEPGRDFALGIEAEFKDPDVHHAKQTKCYSHFHTRSQRLRDVTVGALTRTG